MSFAIYRNTIKKKMDIFTLFMYIIPLGLHSSAIILLLIRILSVIFKKLSKLTIIIAIMLPTIIDFAHNELIIIPRKREVKALPALFK